MLILVADDEESIAELYARYFMDFGFRGATPVFFLENLVASVAAQQPDIVLLDIVFHGGQIALEHIPAIRRACPGVRIMINASSSDMALVDRATQLKCEGIIGKACSLPEILVAVRAVAAGDIYRSPRIKREEIAILCTPLRPLNHRQRRLLALLQTGRTHAEIAKCRETQLKALDDAVRRLRRNLQLASEVTNWRLVCLHDDAI